MRGEKQLLLCKCCDLHLVHLWIIPRRNLMRALRAKPNTCHFAPICIISFPGCLVICDEIPWNRAIFRPVRTIYKDCGILQFPTGRAFRSIHIDRPIDFLNGTAMAVAVLNRLFLIFRLSFAGQPSHFWSCFFGRVDTSFPAPFLYTKITSLTSRLVKPC